MPTREQYSFRPPRYYNKIVKPSPPPSIDDNDDDSNHDDMEYSVLGIRARYAEPDNYDEYEIELPSWKTPKASVGRPSHVKELRKKFEGS
jgi:hypothetical protein